MTDGMEKKVGRARRGNGAEVLMEVAGIDRAVTQLKV